MASQCGKCLPDGMKGCFHCARVDWRLTGSQSTLLIVVCKEVKYWDRVHNGGEVRVDVKVSAECTPNDPDGLGGLLLAGRNASGREFF